MSGGTAEEEKEPQRSREGSLHIMASSTPLPEVAWVACVFVKLSEQALVLRCPINMSISHLEHATNGSSAKWYAVGLWRVVLDHS